MLAEKICIKWDDFQENMSSSFARIRKDFEFSDVTLACEDGQQLAAHRAILAASSPYFQKLFRRNKHIHPLVFMRDVDFQDLVAIVDFLYSGEANILQENLDSFMALAEDLKLEGIFGEKNGTEIPSPSTEDQESFSNAPPTNMDLGKTCKTSFLKRGWGTPCFGRRTISFLVKFESSVLCILVA